MQSFVTCDVDVFCNVTTSSVTFRSLLSIEQCTAVGGDDSPPPNSQSYLIYNLISLMKSSRNIICKLYNANIVIVLSFLVQMLSNNRYCHATVLCQLIYILTHQFLSIAQNVSLREPSFAWKSRVTVKNPDYYFILAI